MSTFVPMTPEEKVNVDLLQKRFSEEAIEHKFTDTTVMRFLRGRKHDAEKAYRAMKRHLDWRKENNVDSLTPDSFENELKANKVILSGKDKEGRPIIFIIVRNHNKDNRDIEEMKRYIIYTLENTIKASNPEEEKMLIVFDMTNFGFSCMDYEVVKMLINILEFNYPETLHTAILLSSPMIFSGCWMVISPWLDPVTKAKVAFVNKSKITEIIDENMIPEIVLPKKK